MVFCKCQECKALNIVAGGREVSTVTKWRHNKKENEWHTYLDNFDSMFSINDPLTNQENELELVQNQYQKQDIFQREIVNQNESEDLGVDSSYEKYNELSPNNDSPIHPADDISLRDNESDNSEPSLDDSIYSADISLEDYDSEYLDITPDSSQNSNDDDDLEESQNSNDDNDDLEESLSDMSIDDDVIDDSNETVSELSESMILALRLLDLKCKHNFTNNAFTNILNLIGGGLGEGSTLYLAKQRLNRLVDLKLNHVDMCKNSCCAFTGIYINDVTCRFCNLERYIISNNSKKPQEPQKTAMYFPLLERFRIQYADSERALKLRYRSQREECDDEYSDIFDGDLYKELVEEGFFSDERDIALIGSTDGYQIFRQKTDSCWILMFINANLPPTIRVKKENLLISAIIPGPNQPKDFNSFLRPIIDELKVLQEGVSIYDALLKENFILRCHVVMWTGDMPAVSKLMCMTGHNAYLGCRYCYLKGVYSEESRHVYFPCSMPRTSDITDFDPKELPKRTEDNFLNDISKIINETNKKTKVSVIKETGINGRSILFELKSTKFPRSFPVDIMHLFFENISINMFKHWSGTYFKDQSLNNEQYVLNSQVWKQIGQIMHECRKQIPLEFGRSPRNIFKHHNGYKAVEWSDWITVYSIPFLLNKLSAKYLKGWAKFVQAVQKCLQFTLTSNDLDKVQQLLLEFYKHYESDYYQKKEEKLSAMLMSFHYLLHVADSIKDCGPCWVSWQYPMERLCGMLLPLVHSKLHPYVNLANNVMLMEKINYLSYISASKHIIKNNSRKNWPQHKVFSLENYDEELYFPSVIYSLDRRNELQKLIHFYSAILEISKEEIVSSIDNKCIKYGRMRTKDGHYVGIKYFQGKSSKYGFIDISDIDRCVGFIELNNKIYIFDKENQVFKDTSNIIFGTWEFKVLLSSFIWHYRFICIEVLLSSSSLALKIS
ncbi:transposase domain-containing protein [Rhizophagus irregularis DAOM 181602=DAOM 197198]|nr:transposase domain-containing protein [Rhizophagus irregularis DAOM 181602=DAOM 197198]